MDQKNKKPFNPLLIVPIGLLSLIVIVMVVFFIIGYEITTSIVFFFLLLSAFLVMQIIKQVKTRYQVKKAVEDIQKADDLAVDGDIISAIKIWKNLLLTLPKEQYLSVISKLEAAYQKENMDNAVEQTRAIKSKSLKFFNAVQNNKKVSPKDRQEWQTQVKEIRTMVTALPEEPEQSLEDTIQED
jgi:hypothetical protein